MATMELYRMTRKELEDFADQVKAAVVSALVGEGYCEEETADQWCARHTILLRNKSIFRTITKLWKEDEGYELADVVMIVKRVR